MGTANRLDATVLDPERGLITVAGWTGAPLAVEAARTFRQGQRLRLYLRPEELHLSAGGEAGDLSGQVTDKRFLGSITRLSMNVGSNTLVADLQGNEASAFPVGAPVSVRLSPLAAHVLSAE